MEADQEDTQQSSKDPHGQIEELQVEKRRMIDEFNAQRAKMKELFLQKEAELMKKNEENTELSQKISTLKNELDDIKSQLVAHSMRKTDFEVEKRKAEEEIASLQRLVHETVEDSSSTRSLYDQELAKLQSYIQYLQTEIENLKAENSHYQQQATSSQEHSLAPSVVINALTKGIAKKLDAFGGSQDEKSSEKVQEDAELLRSLIDPLEDQIKALKEKLRATDEQLQKCKECRHLTNNEPKLADQIHDKINLQSTTATNTSFDLQKSENLSCDMCSNYEAQLVKEQQNVAELMGKVQAAEKSAERHKEDLVKEIGFRKEMEERWNEKREEHKQQVAELSTLTACTEQDLKELRQFFNETTREMRTELGRVTREREKMCYELDKLQRENENLVGKYTVHSQQLQSEAINLPDTVEELHELVLKNHQDLIIAKIGKEASEDKVNELQSDLMLLKHERTSVEEALDHEIRNLKKAIDKLERERKQYLAKNANVIEKEQRIVELENAVKKLESQNSELKTRVHSLQQELENTEAVQRDFVRLSQSLQVQLEKIRESDTQVRWQHEEDVEACTNCRNQFSNSKKKQHCRHCGQIFCLNCLSRTVQSGPNLRPSKVCDVCHTLLVKTSAPYFSKEPPMT